VDTVHSFDLRTTESVVGERRSVDQRPSEEAAA
jgi:hypothetical protein